MFAVSSFFNLVSISIDKGIKTFSYRQNFLFPFPRITRITSIFSLAKVADRQNKLQSRKVSSTYHANLHESFHFGFGL